jgi:hypothetical protein
MPKELFNQNQVDEFSDSDRIAAGVPGQVGAKNMLWSKFKEVVNGIVTTLTAGKVDKITDYSLVPDTEIAKLSEYPEIPASPVNQFLRDDGTFANISSGITPTASNLYASNVDSAVSGYKVASYTVDVAETLKTIVGVTENVIAWGEKYLFDNQYASTQIDSGLWQLHLYGKVDSGIGISKAVLRAFKYSILGVETELFQSQSLEINDTSDYSSIYVDYNSPEIALLTTDRIGFQIGFVCSTVADKTLTYAIGDGYASHLTAPFALRHSQLRNINEEANYQHITQTEKTVLLEHIDGADEEKHETFQLTNEEALPNVETAAGAKASVIFGNINARLFEQIGFALSGYDQDVTTSSQDILKSLPYAFKAYELRADFATAPNGSSAIVTFYKNGVSIGTCTILATEFVGVTVLDPIVSFSKGDSLSAVVTQIGMTIPGKTAKAYIQGIKYQ